MAGRSPGEMGAIARREWAIPAAAGLPIAALVLAAVGVLGETAAVWLALAIGVVTLGVQGARYAVVQQLGEPEPSWRSRSTCASGS